MFKAGFRIAKHVMCGAGFLAISYTASNALEAFQSDCNAYLAFQGNLTGNVLDSPGFRHDGQPGKHQHYSLLILPDIGTFVVGRRGNNVPVQAQFLSQDQFVSILNQGLSRGPREDLSPGQAANWVMGNFTCVARDDYLRSTLESTIENITQKFEASEMRVRDALLRSFSGQMAELIGQINSIRQQIPGLPQRDRDELNERLVTLEAQIDTALNDICVAIKLDEEQC